MKTMVFLLILIIFLPHTLLSQQPQKQTIEEKLIRLEAGQQNLEKRLEDLRNDVNIRFAELRADMNNRFESVDKQFESVDKQFESVDKQFESVDKRFDDLKFWLQIIFGAVVALLGAIIIQWMIMWKRITKVEAQVEDRIVLGYREEDIRDLRRRMEKLEASLMK